MSFPLRSSIATLLRGSACFAVLAAALLLASSAMAGAFPVAGAHAEATVTVPDAPCCGMVNDGPATATATFTANGTGFGEAFGQATVGGALKSRAEVESAAGNDDPSTFAPRHDLGPDDGVRRRRAPDEREPHRSSGSKTPRPSRSAPAHRASRSPSSPSRPRQRCWASGWRSSRARVVGASSGPTPGAASSSPGWRAWQRRSCGARSPRGSRGW